MGSVVFINFYQTQKILCFSPTREILWWWGQTLVSLGSKYAYKKVFVIWRKTEPSLRKKRFQHLVTRYMRQNNIFTFCRWKISPSELFSSKKWWVSSHELFYPRKIFLFARFLPFTFSSVTNPDKLPRLTKTFLETFLSPRNNGTLNISKFSSIVLLSFVKFCSDATIKLNPTFCLY